MTRESSEAPARCCSRCGGALDSGARFCSTCGQDSSATIPAAAKPGEPALQKNRRAVFAIATVYGGVLLAIAVLPSPSAAEEESPLGFLLGHLLFAGVGLLGVRILGGTALRRSLAFRPNGRDLLLGVAGGAVMLASGILYVFLLRWVLGEAAEGEPIDASWPLLVLDVAVLPAMIEEWLCRGVLWDAASRVAPERTVIVVTALLFALLHGVGWGPLGLPHRFLGGLVLGWVRVRTGSLVPGMVGHFLNNLVAISLP